MPRVAAPPEATGKFPRAARVRRRREFIRIQAEGIRVHTNAFTIIVSVKEIGVRGDRALRARLGLTVSKRVGNAVVRNRLRRILREIFRKRAEELPPVDFVIIAKPSAALLSKRGLAAVSEEISPTLDSAVMKIEARAKRKDRHE